MTSPEPSENNIFLMLLPMETQKALLEDWLARGKLGYIRGEGLADHASYIDMIAKENDCTIDYVLGLNGYPV